MRPEPFRVVARRQETADTVTLDIAPCDGRARTVGPGQFAMLWPFGIGEAAISYSGIGLPGETAGVRHTIRSAGPTSAALCSLDVGDVVGVRGPLGRGWTVAPDPEVPLLIVAGGLGLAPLRPVVELLADTDRRAPVRLMIGARDPEQLLYRDELDRWRGAGIDVAVTVDRARSGWSGSVGFVTELIDEAPVPTDATALVCGPELMMRFTARRLEERGVRPDRIQVSLERNMHCGIGHCGHCQLGARFVCTDGPVLPWSSVAELVSVADR
ncbi:MAG: FAD/NAD(P)-binding protein [Actinomycetota bacterium]